MSVPDRDGCNLLTLVAAMITNGDSGASPLPSGGRRSACGKWQGCLAQGWRACGLVPAEDPCPGLAGAVPPAGLGVAGQGAFRVGAAPDCGGCGQQASGCE